MSKKVTPKPLSMLWKKIDHKFYPVKNYTSYYGRLIESVTPKRQTNV